MSLVATKDKSMFGSSRKKLKCSEDSESSAFTKENSIHKEIINTFVPSPRHDDSYNIEDYMYPTVMNKKEAQRITSFFLREHGSNASFSKSEADRTPLFFADILHLLIFSQMGSHSPMIPRWCYMDDTYLVNHAVVLVVDGLSSYNLQSSESKISFINQKFSSCKVEVIMPMQHKKKFSKELAFLPVISSDAGKLVSKYGNLNLAFRKTEIVVRSLKSFFSIDPVTICRDDCNYAVNDKFPRTDLLLSCWQLVDEKYPVPMKGPLGKMYESFVPTKTRYACVTENSPMFSIDCEMCMTKVDDKELTRICVVNEKLECVYETLVKPRRKIINYLTRFSGVTKNMLANVKVRLEDVQKALQELLPPDAILIGHSLNLDLMSLKMTHPYVVDTSVAYNLSGVYRSKAKLALLSKMYLGEVIQDNEKGHCPKEDSIAAMKLVQFKLSHSLSFGDAVISDSRPAKPLKPRAHLKEFIKNQGTTTIFSSPKNIKRYRRYIRKIVSSADSTKYESASSPDDTKDEKEESFSKIDFSPEDSCEKAVIKTCHAISKNQLVICHVSVDEGTNSEEAVCHVNEWTQKVWDSAPKNTLCSTILTGSENSKASGAVLISVKDENPSWLKT